MACILASVGGLAAWYRLGKTWFLGYEKTSHMKMKPQAKSKPQHSEVFLSQAGSELWQRFHRTLCSVGKTLPGLSTALPPQSPKLQCYLKKSVRKDFSFPDHWQMFAQIYFGGISSTLLSFLLQELKEYFKNAFIFPLFLSLCCPLYSFLASLFLSFFHPWPAWLQRGFICHVMEKACCGRGRADLLPCSAASGSLSTHVHYKLEQLNWWKDPSQPTRHHRPLRSAKLVLTDHILVRQDLRWSTQGRGMDRYWKYEVHMLLASCGENLLTET